MLRQRGTLLVVLSLVLGGLAAWGANSWVKGRLAGEADGNRVNVVAAAMEIPYGTKIESRHLRMTAVAKDAVPEGALLKMDEAVEKVSTRALERGEFLNRNRLVEHDQGSTLAALIQPNMRAISVRVNDVVGVGGFLLPGNYVDVLASRVDMRTKRATTATILKNLRVLAVDQTASTDQDEPVVVRAVTLEMTPDQSEILVKAQEEGSLQLTLRNPLKQDTVAEAPKPAEKVAAPVVRKKRTSRPSSVTTVQVIRGTRVNNEKARI